MPLVHRTFLRLGTDEFYCVTKGVSLFFSPCGFCWSADSLSVNLTSARILFTRQQVWLEVVNLPSNKFFEELVLRNLSTSPLKEILFSPRRVSRSEIRVSKCLCWFKMCTDVKDSVFVEPLALKDSGVWETYFLLWNFSHKSYRRMMYVCFQNKLIYRLRSCFPQGESIWNIVNVSFPIERFSVRVHFCSVCFIVRASLRNH